MRVLNKRLVTLEQSAGITGEWDCRKPTHLVLVNDHDYAAGLTKYMADHPDRPVAADGHNVIWIQIITPKLDASGRVIPRDKSNDKEGLGEGPSLDDVLAQLETNQSSEEEDLPHAA